MCEKVVEASTNPPNPVRNVIKKHLTNPTSFSDKYISLLHNILHHHEIDLYLSHLLTPFPSWNLIIPEINLTLTKYKKSEYSSLFIKNKYSEIIDEFSDFKLCFTDGSVHFH